jgi:4-oxalocrotonate tautomerase
MISVALKINFIKENIMPVITVAIHPIDQDQKKHLIKELTETAVKITNVPADKYVVFIDEYENEAIGLAGKTRAEIIANTSL